MLNILYTDFNGNTNSSKILLDNINNNDKLYLKNSFNTSTKELINMINDSMYDLIISFGQAPLDNNTIKIETRGHNINYYQTDFDYSQLKEKLEYNNYKVIISNDAGNYLCNNLYYNGLKYIKDNNLNCQMVFVHIPKLKNIDDIKQLSSIF